MAQARRKDGQNTERDTNARAREQIALDLKSQGYDFDYIAQACGYTHRSAARKAWQRAVEDIARERVESERANFKRAYNAIRQTLHKRARAGDARAVEALVRLDERECRLFGYDAPPPETTGNQNVRRVYERRAS